MTVIDKGDFAVILTDVVKEKLKLLQKMNLVGVEFDSAVELIAKEVEMYCLLSGVLKCELRGSPPAHSPPENIWDEMCLYLFEYTEDGG